MAFDVCSCPTCGRIYSLAVVKRKLAERRGKADKIVGRMQLKAAQRSIACDSCGDVVYREVDEQKKDAGGKLVYAADGTPTMVQKVLRGKVGAA